MILNVKMYHTKFEVSIHVMEKIDVSFKKWGTVRMDRSKQLQHIPNMKSTMMTGKYRLVWVQLLQSRNVAQHMSIVSFNLASCGYAHVRNPDRRHQVHEMFQQILPSPSVNVPEPNKCDREMDCANDSPMISSEFASLSCTPISWYRTDPTG
jgi:hypothetical protein